MFALLLAAACSGDSFEELQGELDHLVATPTQLFLEVGESKTVIVSGVDAQGNPLTLDYVVTAFGPQIDTLGGPRRDSTFLPVYVDDSTLQVPSAGERYRFIVIGDSYGSTSFTVSAGGQDLVIPVQVVPQTTIVAGISNVTPALGEVVTITAPAGTHFSATSVVTQPDPTGAQPFVVSVAADGSSIDVILPPNLIDAQLTISDVTTDAAPTVVFAPSTALTVTTATVPNFPGTISNLTPAVNEAVTVNLTGASIDPAATLILGAGAPTVTDLSATSVTFIPAPGAQGLLVINGVILDALPQIPLNLQAAETDTIKVGVDVPEVAGTGDPGTAPSLLVPSVGLNSVLYDNPASFDYPAPIFGGAFGDFPARLYKVTLSQETTLTVTMEWGSGEDLGGYWFEADGTTEPAFDPADAHGEGAEASPETTTNVMPAGTYLLAVVNFSATNPPLMNITLTNELPAAAVQKVAAAKAAVRKQGR